MSKNNFLSVASNMMLMYGKCKACVQVQYCPNSLPCAHARYYEDGATKQSFPPPFVFRGTVITMFLCFVFSLTFFSSFLSGTVQVLLLLVLHEFEKCFLVSVYFKTDLTKKSYEHKILLLHAPSPSVVCSFYSASPLPVEQVIFTWLLFFCSLKVFNTTSRQAFWLKPKVASSKLLTSCKAWIGQLTHFFYFIFFQRKWSCKLFNI